MTQKPGNRLSTAFTIISALAALFVAAEGVFQAFGSTICPAQGCQLVARYARYGDISILLFGFLLFSLLTALSILAASDRLPLYGDALNLVLIVALASEGFFTGYQAFRLHTPCFFCLIVFGFIVILSAIRLFQRQKAMIAGFASLLAIFSLFYLVLPAGSTTSIPGNRELVLFYGKDCKYCAELMSILDEKKIPVEHVLVNEYAGMLKNMGIEHVPTLYVNKKNERIFLTGKEAILGYLTCSDRKTDSKPAPRQPKKETGVVKQPQTFNPFDAAGQGSQNQPFQIVLPPAQEGVCRSDENCK